MVRGSNSESAPVASADNDNSTSNNHEENNTNDDDDDSFDKLIDQLDLMGIATTPYGDDDDKLVDDDIQIGAKWIRDSSNIMILSGAGISVSAGIPDFRTPGTGLYDNLQKYNLPVAEAIFDIDYYSKKPEAFLSLAKELWPGIKHSPTVTHSFISMLAKKNKLLRSYTQNIDGLEHLAQVPEELLVECHGHFRTASCIACQHPMDGDECKRIILETDNIPTCENCDKKKKKKKKGHRNGYVKPDIVFFGEGLPPRFFKSLQTDIPKVDLLIVMGTSLMVAPVNLIPEYVKNGTKRILINRDEAGNFSDEKNDLVLLGDCDTTCLQLASELGWDIQKLNRETKIVEKKKKKKGS